eukprot:653032-Lingulodinium_polyedra.AAC.1
MRVCPDRDASSAGNGLCVLFREVGRGGPASSEHKPRFVKRVVAEHGPARHGLRPAFVLAHRFALLLPRAGVPASLRAPI